MAFELEIFADENIDADYIEWLIDERSVEIQRHFNKLWEYYSNRAVDIYGSCAADRKVNESGRCYVQAQEYGLPARITGLSRSTRAGLFSGEPVRDVQRKEVVIENDIGWRINAAVDFLFGKTIGFASKAADAQRRAEIETLIKAMFAANGGIGFFQDMAVLGSVYGFVEYGQDGWKTKYTEVPLLNTAEPTILAGLFQFFNNSIGSGVGYNFKYLEGDYRIYYGQSSSASYRSSGAEDFYHSSWYFQEGNFDQPGDECMVEKHYAGFTCSASRFFPLWRAPYHEDGLKLTWQVGESAIPDPGNTYTRWLTWYYK